MSGTKRLEAGAGKAEIVFSGDMFPTFGEGYCGVHDAPAVRVLILKGDGASFALVNFELVSVNDDVESFKQMTYEETGISDSWICVTHSLETPHLFAPTPAMSEAELARYHKLHGAVTDALRSALRMAAANVMPAHFAFGAGSCGINVNRNVSTADGYWIGCNDDEPVDRSVLVYKFSDEVGRVIAILFNYNCQCSIMDGAVASQGQRLITADLAGSSSAFVEREYGGAVAMYCLGAGGDQAPGLQARRIVRGRDGKAAITDVHEAGYLLVSQLGERLGQEVVQIADGLVCSELTDPLRVSRRELTLKGQLIPEQRPLAPRREYTFTPAADVRTPVEVLQLGDTALVGVRPEVCSRLVMSLKQRSPYRGTGLMTFVNGGAKYMGEKEMYEKRTFQAINSRFAAGSAELLLEGVLSLLDETKSI